jgi:hypothetical protein
MNRLLEMPALNLQPVTEFHVKICEELGHATHTTTSGEVDIHCPRCGKLRDWTDADTAGAEPWLQVAEAARMAHHKIASHPDWKVAGGASYARSRQAFKATLRAAYPDINTDTLYGIWLDNMENLIYCAVIARTYPRDDLQRFTAMGRD